MTDPLPRHARPGTEPAVRPDEQLVLDLLCKGRTNEEIARATGHSIEMVGYRIRCLASRLGARNRTALAYLAGCKGLAR